MLRTRYLSVADEVEPEQYYTYFLERVKDLLDGNMEASAFEDALRELFGIHAYIVFTMDKIVQNIVRQVCALRDDVRVTGWLCIRVIAILSVNTSGIVGIAIVKTAACA